MITGFNLGQMHHFAQIEWLNNGFVSDALIERVKREIDPKELEICRMLGTPANEWSLDHVGYNHPMYTQQINNRRDLLQPSISYFYAFVDFYKKVGFKKLVWTINTISAWSNPSERKLWEKRMWDMLDALDKEGILVEVFCLENEMWMYPSCVVMGNGGLNVFHKLAIAGLKGIFMSDNAFKPIVQKGMREFHQYLESITKQLRKRYPSAKIAISIDDDSHLRGKWLSEVTKEFSFYDIVTPHIYISPRDKKELNAIVNKRLSHAKSFKKEIWVTEWNWSYGANEFTSDQGYYKDVYFDSHMLSAFKSNDVKGAFKHTMWAGRSAYGQLPYIEEKF